MITRLRIQNFLSLRDIDVQLGQRNFLLGRNMSGKSNFLKSLRFLSRMVGIGLNKTLIDFGGFQELPWKGTDESTIAFDLSAKLQDSQGTLRTYGYQLSIIGTTTGGIGLASVKHEKLTVTNDKYSVTLFERENGHGEIKNMDGTIAFVMDEEPSKSALEHAVHWDGSTFRNFLARCFFYAISPQRIKSTPNFPVQQVFLSENGDNFSSWLLTLSQSYRKEFELIRQAAIDVLPELQEILTPVTQFSTTYLATEEKHLKRAVTIQHLSEGQLAFLALLSLIYSPPSLTAPIYCIEEPENYLHPKLIETLISVITQRQKELGSHNILAQLIATTHSPILIDKLELDDLIIFSKSNGSTEIYRPNTKRDLLKILQSEGMGLGDLWYSGSLEKN